MTDPLDPAHLDPSTALILETLRTPYTPQERRAAVERIAVHRAALLLELARLDAMQAGHSAALEAEQEQTA